MTEGLTTSKSIPTEKQVDKQKVKQLSREELAKRNRQDLKILESYQVQIETLVIDIERLEKYIDLKLPEREMKAQLEGLKEQLAKFEKYKSILKERVK